MKILSLGLLLSTTCVASPHSLEVYLTAKEGGHRLERQSDVRFSPKGQPPEKENTVIVDSTKRFQTLVGIGGAITDAAAETFYKLPEDKQREVLRAYYDRGSGIGYSLVRTQINSCDFSSDMYTYVAEGDSDLKTFSIEHDLKYRVPLILAAQQTAGGALTLFASPWSPPAWMKDNRSMLHGGKLKPEFREAWANYYVKFIEAYKKAGLDVWGLTVQNEPLAIQTWESCIYSAEDERDFVRDNLGPALHRGGLDNVKLMIWDHNRGLLYQRAKGVLDDPAAAKYVWGVAYHWYVNDSFENVALVKAAYPNTHLFFSEGCNGPYDAQKIDDWKLGETYGKSIIHDFNAGAEGWTDWNILLDEKGGPNHVGNYCFAPIHGDTRTGKLTYSNPYYYIGHFSKFIRPGATRVIASSTIEELQTTSFKNRDGKTVTVVMNATDKAIDFNLWIGGEAAPVNSPAHSILTLIAQD